MKSALAPALAAALILAGCAQPPQPEPAPLVYEDPTVPPAPVPFTNVIRDEAVVSTQGSRGGAALRQPEDLDVLHNEHYLGTPSAAENGNENAPDVGSDVDHQRASSDASRDKSVYSTKDKSVYAKKSSPKDRSVYAKPGKAGKAALPVLSGKRP